MKSRIRIFWLALAAVLWLAAGCYFAWCQAKLRPAELARSIEKDLHQRQAAVNQLLSQRVLLQHLLHNQLKEEELQLIIRQPFIIRVFNKGKLQFWNSNVSPVQRVDADEIPRIYIQHNDVFLVQRVYDPQDRNLYANMIVPVYWHYDISNQYIKSHFVASPAIPPASVITKDSSGYPVRSLQGNVVCKVYIEEMAIEPWEPDELMILLCIAALTASVIAIHMLAFYLSHRYSLVTGCTFLAIVITGTRLCTYLWELPFHLRYLDIFSPKIFASSTFLPSFGDLILNVLLAYWYMSFVLSRHQRTGGRTFYFLPLWLRWIIYLCIAFLMGCLGLYLLYILQSLVIDSSISFDTNSLNVTDKFTLLVIVIVAMITRLFLISLQFTYFTLNRFIPQSPGKYLLLLVFNALIVALIRKAIIPELPWPGDFREELLYQGAFFLAIVYLYIRNTRWRGSTPSGSDLFAILLEGLYWCLITAVFFTYYIAQNEQYSRINFAEKLSRQQDSELEIKFPEIVSRLRSDSTIYKWITGKQTVPTTDMRRHFEAVYTESFLAKYTGNIYLYKADKSPVNSLNNISFDNLQELLYTSLPTISEGLYFHFENEGNDYYIINIPVRYPRSDSIAGYIMGDMKLRNNIVESLYPQLLQDNQVTSRTITPNYSYAIYSRGVLKAQSGDYNFSLNIGNAPGQLPYRFYDRNGFSELYFKGNEGVIYVVAYRDTFTGILTIFSFLFVIYLLIFLLENWFNLLLSYLITGKKIKAIYRASLGVRIRYFAMGFILVSFLVIGMATVLFLSSRYKASNQKQLEESMINTGEALTDHFEDNDQELTAGNFDVLTTQPGFAYMLNNIARHQKMDINLFDTSGALVISTRNGIYDKHILTRYLSPEAYYQLSRKQYYRLVQTERIGNLSFTSAYMPLINRHGKITGYLNIPSFYSQKALDRQIATLLSTFVYIYTILLLLSGIIIFLFINNLTASLQLVTQRLKQVNLKKNELIHWPYNDEIGLLVAEYNKMVIAVEKNAESLIKDERHNAWREMAKQVAHEIKNPLTPMKLNIQYLQQAIAHNHPDITSMATRVSASIIEQIDNLNYIASEFSSFAKMPEQHNEKLDLIALLQSIVVLYENKETEVSLQYPEEYDSLVILSDKSQMLRIFTNLVKNAAEAIPDGRAGKVNIDVVINSQWNNILVTVKDNGTGIDRDIEDKIFNPYFTTKTTGTGLGLAMTRKMIELWKGEIWFESETGTGTTFFIVLPYTRGTEEDV